MTFYDQEDPRARPSRPPGRPGEGSPGDRYADPDIWSHDESAAAPAADAEADADGEGEGEGEGPRRPPRPRRPAPAVSGPAAHDEHVAPRRHDRGRSGSGGSGWDDGGDDFVDLPGESRVPRWVAVLVVLALIVGVVGLGGRWWYQRQVDPPGPPGEAISVQVPEGSSTSKIGDLLASSGVVSNSTLFNFYLDRKKAGPFQAGTYRLQKHSSFSEAVAQLQKGPGKPITESVTKVTIPEGFTVAKILARIHQKVPRLLVADLQAALDQGKVPSELKPDGQKSYEGLLFPATYEVTDTTDGVQLLTEMAAEMDQRVDALDINAAQAHLKQQWGLDLTAYDMVKVASMIQFEAAVPDDAPKIAAVTYNRMKAGTPLGFDSTSIYYGTLTNTAPDYTGNSPYNTRVHTGLPPTPISAPGAYALQGAIDPADGDWLYFVLTAPKVVSFTASYQEFLGFKAQCRAAGLGCG